MLQGTVLASPSLFLLKYIQPKGDLWTTEPGITNSSWSTYIPVLLVGMVHPKSHITTYYLHLVTWQFWRFFLATEDITQHWLSIFWEPSRCIFNIQYTHRRTYTFDLFWFQNYHEDILQTWLFMNNYNSWSTILRWYFCPHIGLHEILCPRYMDHKIQRLIGKIFWSI